MTTELLIWGLYFNFFSFLRCYIVKQHWIGLLPHKINLVKLSITTSYVISRVTPLPTAPCWLRLPATLRPDHPDPKPGLHKKGRAGLRARVQSVGGM